MTNCGPGGSGIESCCTSLPVTGGTFYRTYTNNGDGGTGEADPATVSSFRLDRYLVTVGRFRQFVAAWSAGWTPPAGSGKHTHLNAGQGLVNAGATTDAGIVYETGWATADNGSIQATQANLSSCAWGSWTSIAGGQENSPMSCVNWYEAAAFCIWDAAFLPSDAEWEYAAAGGSEQREYPWGSADPGYANQYAIYECNYPNSFNSCGSWSFAPVGTTTLGVGAWGQFDLAGEVNEWNLDVPVVPIGFANPCADCTNVTTIPKDRVFRGGDASESASYFPLTTRTSLPPAEFEPGVGFRCARTP
jgi:formylglycine-generating enzyme required for sulfatase activity